jgi:MoaA/NifB/PqqE/SkfB family radical SAM enzyme
MKGNMMATKSFDPHIRQDLLCYAKQTIHHMGPVAGQVEVTSECLQRCKYCSSWKDHERGTVHGQWTLEDYRRLVKELSAFPTFEHLTLTGGDPMCWPHLNAAILTTPDSIRLQITTALAMNVDDPELWRTRVGALRVSLDAATPATYTKIRGCAENTPGLTLERMKKLQHPNLSVYAVMYPENIEESYELLEKLASADFPIRKVMIMGGLAYEDARLGVDFWQSYQRKIEQLREGSYPFETSFAESPVAVRRWCRTAGAQETKCFNGSFAFHLKANGDYYVCCLLGGESIETDQQAMVGNYFQQYTMATLYTDALRARTCMYQTQKCRAVCQFKQAALNALCQEAMNSVRVSMP